MDKHLDRPTSSIRDLIAKHTKGQDMLPQAAAAEYIGRSTRYLQLQEKAGTAPPSIKVGRQRLYFRPGLDAWLAERARK